MEKLENGVAVIFDLNGTIYDPGAKVAIPGALELLATLQSRKVLMYLISKAEDGSRSILDELHIRHFFADHFFVERKDPTLFFQVVTRAQLHPKDVYVIGDNIHKEIRCGNQCGMRTIWLKAGKFSELEPAIMADVPWKTVTTLWDVADLILQSPSISPR